MNELPDELAQALAALDAKAAKAASRVDRERVAARVVERLRVEPAVAPPRRIAIAVRVAAAIAVLAAGGMVVRSLTVGRVPVVSALPVDVPDSLNTQQATAVLEAVAAATDSTAATSAMLTVDDLNEAELRALLQAMQTDTEGSL